MFGHVHRNAMIFIVLGVSVVFGTWGAPPGVFTPNAAAIPNCPAPPCGGPHPDPDDGNNAEPTLSVNANAAHAIEVTWSNVPGSTLRTLARQRAIDWSCLGPPAPGPREVLATFDAASDPQKFVDSTARTGSRYYYYLTWSANNGRQEEILDAIDIASGAQDGLQLRITNTEKRRVEFTWRDGVITESYFAVQRKSGSGWTEVARAPGDHNATCKRFDAVDGGLQADTRYCYRLAIVSAISTGYTPVTVEVCTRTLPLELPRQPRNFTVTAVTDTTVTVAWEYNFIDRLPITGFKLSDRFFDDHVDPDVREFTFTDMRPGKHHTFRIWAKNDDGYSKDYAEVSADTTGEPPGPCGGAPGSPSPSAVLARPRSLSRGSLRRPLL